MSHILGQPCEFQVSGLPLSRAFGRRRRRRPARGRRRNRRRRGRRPGARRARVWTRSPPPSWTSVKIASEILTAIGNRKNEVAHVCNTRYTQLVHSLSTAVRSRRSRTHLLHGCPQLRLPCRVTGTAPTRCMAAVPCDCHAGGCCDCRAAATAVCEPCRVMPCESSARPPSGLRGE